MGLLEIIIAITIVGICAAIAQLIVGYSVSQILQVTLIGVVGAYLGYLIEIAGHSAFAGFPSLVLIRVGTLVFSIGWSIIGSCIILLLLYLISGGTVQSFFARGAER